MDTGAILWKYSADGEIKSVPLVFILGPNDFVCVGAYDRRLHCVHAQSGTSVWKTTAFEASIRAGCAATSDGKVVFCASLDGTMAAVDERGVIVTSVKLGSPVFAALSFLAEKNVLMAANVAGEVRAFHVHMSGYVGIAF
jgi:outer membrane protein assembly factor BamB